MAKKISVDYDYTGSKIINLPQATASGQAVRFDEFSEVDTNVNDLITLSGVAENASNLGTFTGSTIPDSATLKSALQALETEAESNNLTVASGSQSLLSISGNEISVSSLLLTNVTVNTDATDIQDYITDNATEFAGLEEGDILIMTGATDQTKRSYIHNGGSAGDSSDMTRMQVDLNVNTIRAMLAGTSDEIDYNSTTGIFSFSANAAENIAPTSHTWVGLGSPSSIQDFMEKADAEFQGLQGGTSLTVGSVSRAKLADDAVDGTKLADDAVDSEHIAAGAIDLEHMSANSVDSDQYVDGSIDLVHLSDDSVDSRCYVDGSIDLVHLSDDSVDSRCYVDGSIDNVHLSADCVDGAKIADDAVDSEHVAAGAIDFDHFAAASYSTDLSSSASSSELARADAVKNFVNGKRYKASSISLTADTAFTVNHALGEKYVAFSAYDSNDKMLDLEVDLTDANNLTVTSTSTQSGITVVVVA